MATKKNATKMNARAKAIEDRWGKSITDSGWTAIPSVLLRRQHALGLDALDINILIYLMTYWWQAGNDPHPAKETIATAINVHPRTVQRRITRLENGGFLKRKNRQHPSGGSNTNAYSFDGLINALEPFAGEELEIRAKREADNKKQASRKKPKNFQSVPKLKIVK